MYQNPFNLALRLLLEIAALAALAFWGWTQHEGGARLFWALAAPIAAAVLWGVFRVPNDPGPAPVAIPGPLRLLGEWAMFATAVALLVVSGATTAAVILGGLVVIHYIISYDRVGRLLGLSTAV